VRERPLRDRRRRLELRRTGTGCRSRWVHGIDASIVFGKGVISSQFLAVGPATPARPSLTGRIGRHHTSNRHDHQRARFRPQRARDRRPARCRMRVQRRQGRADSPIHAFRTLCRRLSLSGGRATSIRLGRRRARPRRDVAIPGSTHRITHRRRRRRVRTDRPRRPSGRARRPIQASTTEDGSLQTLHGALSGSPSRRGKPVLPTGERGQCRRIAHRHEHDGLSASSWRTRPGPPPIVNRRRSSVEP
jgi:hypothetical protein